MDIRSKKIILTGASSGIGRALLEELIEFENVKIVAVARNISNIPAIRDTVYPFSSDVSTKEGVDNVFSYAQNIYGDTDIFIANAGVAYLEKLQTPDWEHINHIFSLNVFSPIYSLERLISENNSPKTFISIISGVALVSLPGYTLYCSTKAALHHFSETFRYEQNSQLRIMSVYPVATRTDFFDKAAKKANAPLPFPQQSVKTVSRKIVQGIIKGKKKV